MIEEGLCQCGCGGETLIPKGWNRYNRYIKGHTKRKFPRLKVAMLLGHPIPKSVQIHHHGNHGTYAEVGIKDIVVCENQKYHRFLHMRERAYFATPNLKCGVI